MAFMIYAIVPGNVIVTVKVTRTTGKTMAGKKY
jgi:hypothetical protein